MEHIAPDIPRFLVAALNSEKKLCSNFEAARDAYLAFLKPASEWLARGTTEVASLALQRMLYHLNLNLNHVGIVRMARSLFLT
jgi:hypothetical protein